MDRPVETGLWRPIPSDRVTSTGVFMILFVLLSIVRGFGSEVSV